MPIDWEPLRSIIAANQRFVLTSHVRPDADALGSELGMAGLLEQLGKDVRIVNASTVPNRLAFLDPEKKIKQIGTDISEEQALDTDVHMILDTSAWGQLAEAGRVFKRTHAVKVVVDHHATAEDLGAMYFKDIEAEATGALVFLAAESLGIPITPPIARALYCAIATDTGWFRFSSTTGETMRIAGRLIELGAEPWLLYQSLYEQNSMGRIKLASRVLGRIKLDCANRVASTFVRWDDYAETGAEPPDTEDLVNECLTIAGIQVAFIAIEQSNRNIKVSLRSRFPIDVAQVAQQFGGGGHKQAAGAIMPGPLVNAQTKVLAALTSLLQT
jgi:phosphoesterase RecJ-like protein